MDSQEHEVLSEITAALQEGQFLTATFSDLARPKGTPAEEEAPPKRQQVRPVTIRGEQVYQWSLRFERQEKHENLNAAETVARIRQLAGGLYRQAQVALTTAELHLRRDRSGKLHVSRRAPVRTTVETSHDRKKAYLIPDGVPCPFLIAQGVMRPDGRVLASMQHKFRQVNRFLEFVNDVYPSLPAEGTLHVVDYGCGKSYLTFAIHHLLTVVHHRTVQVTGLDRNPDVIATCRRTVNDLQLEGMSFESTAIDGAGLETPLHLAVALHACDTATDHALADAVRRKAAVILAAPCCQHEVAAAMHLAALPLLEGPGIVKERLAALTTDSLRAAALEAAGYKTQVIEFIETDHTPKNLLLRSVLRRPSDPIAPKWRQQYGEMKSAFGLQEIAVDQILDAAHGASATPVPVSAE